VSAGSWIAAVVVFCVRHALAVVAGIAVITALAAYYVFGHFALNSSTENLLSPELPFRQREAKFDAIFPDKRNLILVVIDGVTPERAQEAVTGIGDALQKRPDLFQTVVRPDSGKFFEQNGLLFLSKAELQEALTQIVAAQPFLGALAADPSFRGVLDNLSTALLGVRNGNITLDRIARPVSEVERALQDFFQGRHAFLSWRSLAMGGKPALRETRHLIEVEAVLNYGDLTPGGKASNAIRETARRLGFTPENGVTVRLTGNVPIADEEFATLAARADLIAALMGAALLLMLWFALHSVRLIAAILITILAGLALTTAFGLVFVGAFNVISIAFIALFIGLGVDFGIQVCVRFRAEHHSAGDLEDAFAALGRGLGPSLTLAMMAIAAGFLAFLPTQYLGVAELGLIAGIGMPLTYVLTLTLLPALIALFRPPPPAHESGFRFMAPVDAYLRAHARAIIVAAVVAAVVAGALVPWIDFDFNPLNLRSQKVESMSTLLDLAKDPDTAPSTMDIAASSRQAAAQLAAKLSALPEVSRVVTIDTFIPADQEQKLAQIADAKMLLDLTLNPPVTKPAPSDAELVASLSSVSQQLQDAATPGDANSAAARALAASLDRLAKADPVTRAKAAGMLTAGLGTLLDQIRNLLKAAPITLENVPPEIARDWIAPSGQARVKVFPKGDPTDNAMLRRFAAAVLTVAPDAVGAPLSIAEAGRAISDAFVEAGIYSFVAIAILLFVALRSVRDTLLSLAPLTLAGALTLGSCVALGMNLNYANIIALPLLFGIGVAFDIYFVLAWRAGNRQLLQSPLARAVIFSAGTTASGFGALWLSDHPGTASTGELLMISLGWILAIVLLVMPPLFHLVDGEPRGAAPRS
jgi:hopanoid biosynthesis associated RND transporter like protein HpnN